MRKSSIYLLIFNMIVTWSLWGNPNQNFVPGKEGPWSGMTKSPPGSIPQKFAPGIISTPNHIEFSCTFNPKMTEIYFTRVGGTLGHNYTIMVSRVMKGKLSGPEPVSFDSPYLENEPHITPDGKFLYFNSTRPAKGMRSVFNIWRVSASGKGWQKPEAYREGMFLTVSKNGSLYYTDISSQKDSGIIVCEVFNGKGFSPAVSLGGGVNSPYSDAHPFIAPDESYIIFDSGRPGGYSRNNLYICFRGSDNTWTEAVNLGKEINSGGDTGFACVTPDQKYLFFTKNEDIYWVSSQFLEKLRPIVRTGTPGK